jgi:spermidine/putrescine transport system substrate-binding protein
MIRLGYVEELLPLQLPNFRANAGAPFKSPPHDPGNRYSIPWQAGITGIAFNPRLTGRAIDSVGDLFDPAFRGKVGLFSELLDTVGLTFLLLGVDAQASTTADMRRVADKLAEVRRSGIVRGFYGNDYVDALGRGDLALTMAWSGDVFQLQNDNPELVFVVPKEGGILWVDNMVVPRGAANVAGAHAWMDYFYEPRVAADVTEYVQYISPVPAAQTLIQQDARDRPDERADLERTAGSELIFPTEATLSRLVRYRTLTEDEERTWNEMFQEATQG